MAGMPDPASWLALGTPFAVQLLAVCHELLRNAPLGVQLVAVCHELLSVDLYAVHTDQR